MSADEESHRHAVENLDQADALLFGPVTYEMMEAAFRSPAQSAARGARWLPLRAGRLALLAEAEATCRRRAAGWVR